MPRSSFLLLGVALVVSACGSGAQVTTTPPPTVTEAPVTVSPPAREAATETIEAVRDRLAIGPVTFDPDTVSFSQYDTGRMWTFDVPPTEYLQETYGLAPDEAWYARARLGALRFATYCSASFVSPNGLILTNHHCARTNITAVTQDGEDLDADGFYAAEAGDERQVEDLFVEQLIDITDVTEEIEAALVGQETAAERANARRTTTQAIERRMTAALGGEDAGIRVQVIEFYSGGRYSAYTFRRFDDIRLAFAPEAAVGYFGGDPDNFTYPRHTLDFTLLRAYGPNGQPLDTSDFYFPWSADGTEDGELVFIVGNPGSTTRLQTVAELIYRREVQEPAILRLVSTRADVYDAFVRANPDAEETPELRDTFFSLSNSRKAYTGRVAGLQDPYILTRRQRAEEAFAAAIADDAELRDQYGELLGRIAQNRREALELDSEYGAFLGMNPGSATASNVLGRALYAYAFGMTGNPALREQALSAEEERPEALEVALIQAKLDDFVHYFGEGDPVVRQVLQGRSTAEAAQALYDGSALTTREGLQGVLEAGNVARSSDPAIAVARAIFPRFSSYQQQLGALNAQLSDLSAQLARARFAIFGTDIPPDATFSLRINDGVVRGYPYNGTMAPPYTTFYGMYDRHYSHSGTDLEEFFELPERWLAMPEALDLSTPYNFVSTNDIIGGNSGSPMLNADLEIIGLAFDGNIESLPGDYIYLGELNRTVAVDSRAILHSLEAVYEAARLVDEIRSAMREPVAN